MMHNWINSFSAGLGDSLNPVFVKELRQMLRGRCLRYGFYGLLVGQVLGFYLLCNTTLSTERSAIWGFYGSLLIGMVWWLLGDGVNRWSSERAIDGISPEFTTMLSPDVIVSGKLLAMLAGGGVLLVFGLPLAAVLIGYLWNVGGEMSYNWTRLTQLLLYLLWLPVGVLVMMGLNLMHPTGKKNGWVIAVIIFSMFFWIGVQNGRAYEMNDLRRQLESLVLLVLFGFVLYFSCTGKLLSPAVDRLRRSHFAILAAMVGLVIYGLVQKDFTESGSIFLLAACAIFPGLDELRQRLRGRIFFGGTVRAMALALLSVGLGAGLLVDWRAETPDAGAYSCAFLMLFYAEVAVLLRQLNFKAGPFSLFFLVAAAGNLIALPSVLLKSSAYCLFSPAILHYWNGADGVLWCGGLALAMLAVIAARWYFSLPVRQKA